MRIIVAATRGHEITAVTRNSSQVEGAAHAVVGNVLDVDSPVQSAGGQDALVASVSSGS